MEENELDYEKHLAIDPYTLDEDWLMQPVLYGRYSRLTAEAETDRNIAKERLDVVKAETDLKIRKDPAKYGLEKATEAFFASTILRQPEYREASNALIDANFRFAVLQGAVRALDHKKAALENEVRLWLGSYYSGPKEPREIPAGKRMADIARDKVSGRLREEMNREMRDLHRDLNRPSTLMTEKEEANVVGQSSLPKEDKSLPRRRRG